MTAKTMREKNVTKSEVKPNTSLTTLQEVKIYEEILGDRCQQMRKYRRYEETHRKLYLPKMMREKLYPVWKSKECKLTTKFFPQRKA
jgi:hypothetical protein